MSGREGDDIEELIKRSLNRSPSNVGLIAPGSGRLWGVSGARRKVKEPLLVLTVRPFQSIRFRITKLYAKKKNGKNAFLKQHVIWPTRQTRLRFGVDHEEINRDTRAGNTKGIYHRSSENFRRGERKLNS